MNVFVVLWSRTEHGKQNIRGIYKTLRQAKAAIKEATPYEGGWFTSKEYSSVDLLEPLKDLVRVLRNFEVGDYSPIMDELFDAESAIRIAENKQKRGIDY